jgi:hypothetical protein
MSEKYSNMATSDHKALIVYLLDISGSMDQPISKAGKTRIEAVTDALYVTIQEMVARSVKQGVIRPRYEVAMYAYSDDVYDIYSGKKTIDYISEKGIPELHLQNRTNMALGFECVKNFLVNEMQSWDEEQLRMRPAPLVVHMTDAEITERLGDPSPFFEEIKKLEVADGNVLIENIFVTDHIRLPTSDLHVFSGYKVGETLDNPFGEKLLTMSSILPEAFRTLINREQGMNLKAGTSMMYPGTTTDFVQVAFQISGISGVAQDTSPDAKRVWEDP